MSDFIELTEKGTNMKHLFRKSAICEIVEEYDSVGGCDIIKGYGFTGVKESYKSVVEQMTGMSEKTSNNNEEYLRGRNDAIKEYLHLMQEMPTIEDPPGTGIRFMTIEEMADVVMKNKGRRKE